MDQVLVALIPEPHAPVELREVAEPQLEQNSALLEVELSEVCGTDVHLQQGRLKGVPYPLIPGHVSVGRLGKIRGRLYDVDGRPFGEGDRVTFLDVHRTCNACWHCLVARATTRCPSRKVYGITYGLADGLSGGWAQKIYLKPDTRCIRLGATNVETFMAGGRPLPAALHAQERAGAGSGGPGRDARGAARAMGRGGTTGARVARGGCALPTALHATERAGVEIGDTALVLGSGPVGL